MANLIDSYVETPAAPEWLSKLESRREKLTRGKLGHESGAGAPCNECDKCPGLDLHFWRKVCRNCKCRKDQHMCSDDDLSGWAQFEILGQIRSKPAYIKIKVLADEPVKLEWVPPNIAPDLVNDYMVKIGTEQIPVAGSDAATKRKQQLEFQVPPHDLDADLCDNLTESEANQLQQYVQKIRENCVGQGSVVRVGTVVRGSINHVLSPSYGMENSLNEQQHQILQKLNVSPAEVYNDNLAINIINSEPLAVAVLCDQINTYEKPLIAFTEPLRTYDFKGVPNIQEDLQSGLESLNKFAIKSLVYNGPFYDKIIDNLNSKRFDISADPVLKPIADFRKEYTTNPKYNDNIKKLLDTISPEYTSPIKGKLSQHEGFHSPIPLRNPIQARSSAIVNQDTPMRKVKFGGVNIFYELGLPADSQVKKDPIFAKILTSGQLQGAMQLTPSRLRGKNVIVSLSPVKPDFEETPDLSNGNKNVLQNLEVNTDIIKSAVVNGLFYDKLFDNLKQKGIYYGDCKLLKPIENVREKMLNNPDFKKDITNYVYSIPNSLDIAYSSVPEHNYNKPGSLLNPTNPFRAGLSNSQSSDSGFESKPSTPNYLTHPLIADEIKKPNECNDLSIVGIQASSGKFSSIPGIEDLNMYPQLGTTPKPLTACLEKNLQDLQISSDQDNTQNYIPVPVLNCKDCQNHIMSGEVAIKASRAGTDIAWHPQCFKCHECRELLADLVYFFHGGNVYCGRDLAIILKIPRCMACDELIFTKEYTAAEGSTFHIKHFCCYQCDDPLAGHQYIPDEKTNMPLCLKCYDEFFAARCEFCSNAIGPTEQGVAWGNVHWHGNCFNCAGLNCGKSLIGGRFCVKNNMPFCSPICVKSVVI